MERTPPAGEVCDDARPRADVGGDAHAATLLPREEPAVTVRLASRPRTRSDSDRGGGRCRRRRGHEGTGGVERTPPAGDVRDDARPSADVGGDAHAATLTSRRNRQGALRQREALMRTLTIENM